MNSIYWNTTYINCFPYLLDEWIHHKNEIYKCIVSPSILYYLIILTSQYTKNFNALLISGNLEFFPRFLYSTNLEIKIVYPEWCEKYCNTHFYIFGWNVTWYSIRKRTLRDDSNIVSYCVYCWKYWLMILMSPTCAVWRTFEKYTCSRVE